MARDSLRRMRALWFLAISACAPIVDAPTERARTADREDAAQLSVQLRSLPGIATAEVMLRRSVRDPLTGSAPAPYASAVIVVDTPFYRSSSEAGAIRLIRAAVPEVERPEILVEVGRPPPKMASVGPFQVATGTKPRLMATLIVGLLLIAMLAGYVAYLARRQAA